MEQRTIEPDGIGDWLKDKHVLLVCGRSFDRLEIRKHFAGNIEARFSSFTANPTYESVIAGVECFKRHACDAIVAVGGGSAMDVAKCIKLFSSMDSGRNYLEQEIKGNAIPFMAVPTTAGTGSEATRFAVIYHKGEKQSVSHSSCIPGTVVFDATALHSLPIYQKKAAMMDAFCHAVESFWSVNSTDGSKEYAREAIGIILGNIDGYLACEGDAEGQMLKAANIAGRAIDITQTTAGHAMCYKLTSLYGIAHGHAAALCVARLWPYMISHPEDCTDPRGKGYLCRVFDEVADAMDAPGAMAAADRFQGIMTQLGLDAPEPEEADFELLKASVNQVRLRNNPEELDRAAIDYLYHQILKGGQ